MEINVNGNPGTGNRYEDVKLEQVGSYNPNAKEVHIHQPAAEHNNRLVTWLSKLQEQVDNNIQIQEKMDSIRRYHTKLPHTLGLKRKLQDGGFTKAAIDKACRLKQSYAKKATKYQYYEMANRIDDYLFAIVSNHFDVYVLPLIEAEKPLSEINLAVYEKVIIPVVDELNVNGAEDTCLCYTTDDIFGMLYYLTGNCHINWAIYDV